MRNRIFLVAAMLAGVAFTATSASAAPAADECLAKPKGAAPAGKHWYFQTNRTIQRKCWYLGDEGEKTVAVAPRKQSAPATNVNPDKERRVQPPTADARAELVDEPHAEQPAAEQSAMPVAPPQREASQGASGASSQGAFGASDGASPRNWTVASRWPDASESFAASRAPAINDPTPAARVENPPPVVAAAPVQQPSAAVDNARDVDFAPFAAALIFVVIVGGATFMFFSSRRLKKRDSFSEHREMQHPAMPWTGAMVRQPVAAADRIRYSDEIDEVEQLLAISRQARAS